MARTLVTPLFALVLVAGACGGGSSVEGTYSCPDGTTIELRGDGTFTATEGDETVEGTYDLPEGNAIRFFGQGQNISQDGAVQDGSLFLAGVEEPCTKQ
jgi:hypothetical protein